MPSKRVRQTKDADTALLIAIDAHATKGNRKLTDRSAQRIRTEIRRWHQAGEVLGFGVGPKMVGGIWNGEIALQIHVRRKRPLGVLPPDTAIPQEVNWPELDRPVLTDVVERGSFRPASLTGVHRPVFPGLSVGHCISGETGSLGAVVRAFGDSNRYLLGAAHVLAAAGRARLGDEIIQPGGLDGGQCPSQTIGELTVFEKFQPGQGFLNEVDAALVKLKEEIRDVTGQFPVSRLARPQDVHIHDSLSTIGCRTGDRSVLVKNPSHATTIEFTLPAGGRARFGFRNLILYKDFSQKGDSGGPVVNNSGALVGIHIARTDDGAFGLAMPVWSLPPKWNVVI
jgi:S1-C subfamily serine protease